MSDQPQFLDTPLPSPITEIALQITSNLEGGDHYSSGTGVIVAPYLALAAKHVLEEHWERHHGQALPLSDSAGLFSFVLAQLVGNDLNLWTATRLWTSGLTDIALLRLTPYSTSASDYQFKHLTLDLLPPKVGEQIHAFGYSESVLEATGPKKISLHQRASTAHGQVMEVHHQLRDTASLPFPCFRTNARFDGGMSGGPVFKDSGELCGLVCSSIPAFDSDDEHSSYVVSLWPAMAIPIDLDRVGHERGVRYPVFDLIRDDILVAKNADLVKVGELDENGTTSISFTLP